jgi:hypothetical protein
VSAVTSVAKTVASTGVRAATTAARAAKTVAVAPVKYTWQGAKYVGGKAVDAGKWVGGKVSAGAQAAYGFGKDLVNKIGNLACKVISSDIGSVALVAGAAASGVPPQVGVAGAGVGKQICGGSPEQAAAQAALLEQQQQDKFPLLLVAGGGVAALGLIYYLTTRKKGRR